MHAVILLISLFAGIYIKNAGASNSYKFYERQSEYPDRQAKILSFDNIKKKDSSVIDFGHLSIENNDDLQEFSSNISEILKTVRSRAITVLVPMRYEMERKAYKILDDLISETPSTNFYLRKYNSSGKLKLSEDIILVHPLNVEGVKI